MAINQTPFNFTHRPRRMRRTASLRNMMSEVNLTPYDLVQPLFITEGNNVHDQIPSLEGQARLSIDLLVKEAKELHALGIPGIALFPKIADDKKDQDGSHSADDDNLVGRALKALKDAVPEMMVICDVALDPYSSSGQDGIVRDGKILNDPTVHALIAQALSQARCGADMVAPSDMMDGRIGAIREALDVEGFEKVAIMAYSAKYASSYYGPFRDALDSAPTKGADKKTYQMDPRNIKEALREVALDIDEGADMVMVKPALPYLDVLYQVKQFSNVPVSAYHVSGEYAMLKAAGKLGYMDADKCMLEALTSIKRAGADVIFSYASKWFAQQF